MMRAVFAVSVLATGCATEEPRVDPCARYGAGIATCGEPATYRCNGGCSTEDNLCMGPEQTSGALAGNCRATPGAGSLTVAIDGAPFEATQVAAVADAYLQISAARLESTPQRGLMLRAPAVVGTHDCSEDARGAMALYLDEALVARKVAEMPLPCTITITSIGEVGASITGTFAVTLAAHPPATTPSVLTEGAFEVERGPFP